MSRKMPSKEKIDEWRRARIEMAAVGLDVLSANATKYAEALGAFRDALQKSGFSREESMQIILKVAEQRGRRPMFVGEHGGHWHK
jgi:hypothetical protein